MEKSWSLFPEFHSLQVRFDLVFDLFCRCFLALQWWSLRDKLSSEAAPISLFPQSINENSQLRVWLGQVKWCRQRISSQVDRKDKLTMGQDVPRVAWFQVPSLTRDITAGAIAIDAQEKVAWHFPRAAATALATRNHEAVNHPKPTDFWGTLFWDFPKFEYVRIIADCWGTKVIGTQMFNPWHPNPFNPSHRKQASNQHIDPPSGLACQSWCSDSAPKTPGAKRMLLGWPILNGLSMVTRSSCYDEGKNNATDARGAPHRTTATS